MSLSQASNAQNPDLNWSQIRETIVMLYLSAAQIESSMQEGTESIHRLTNAFTNISGASNKIDSASSDSPETSDQTNSLFSEIRDANADIQTEIQNSVVAFQFHDRITQRLEHVTQCLKKLSELIGTSERIYNPTEWLALQQEIGASYTMEAERLMFEHIMMGASVEEALEIYNHNFNNSPPVDESDDEIELF